MHTPKGNPEPDRQPALPYFSPENQRPTERTEEKNRETLPGIATSRATTETGITKGSIYIFWASVINKFENIAIMASKIKIM